MTRDTVLARLAEARVHVLACVEHLDGCLELFVDPSEDPRGRDREAFIDALIEEAGRLSRVMEKAQAAFEKMDPTERPQEDDDADDESDPD